MPCLALTMEVETDFVDSPEIITDVALTTEIETDFVTDTSVTTTLEMDVE